MLLGRYDWVAKQANLAKWAEEGVPLLQAAGIETAVIGHVPPALQNRLERPGLAFWGEQRDLATALAHGRIGLVPEEIGGGFKMKTLDYIFHGLPVAALSGSLSGLSDRIRAQTLQAPSQRALAETIIAAIDDLPRLNALQTTARALAAQEFDWQERGKRLAAAIRQVGLPARKPQG
jgi:glycosyltransferase involved in cell wall biosynthesis